MQSSICKICTREYAGYCSNEICPTYKKLVNKNFKEFMNKVIVKPEREKKDIFLAHCKLCLRIVEREVDNGVGFTCYSCKRIKYKKQVWKKNNS